MVVHVLYGGTRGARSGYRKDAILANCWGLQKMIYKHDIDSDTMKLRSDFRRK